MKKYYLFTILGSLFLMLFSISVQTDRTYNIKNFGATGDGKTLESPAINKVIIWGDVLDDVKGVGFMNLKAQHAPNIPTFVLKNVENFSTRLCVEIPDLNLKRTDSRKL